MLTLSCALLSASLVCWPSAGSAVRLRAVSGRGSSARPGHRSARQLAEIAAVPSAGAVALLVFGPAGALVGALLGLTALRRWRSRRLSRARNAATRGVADALGGLVAELRAGAHPAIAAEAVAADSPPDGPAAVALRSVAAAARLGGDVDVALADTAASGEAADVLARLARAWSLAQQHGLPLADVLDAVRRDLDASARFASQLQARLAGPRASAAVLAGLPAVGLLLGEAMGARPVGVLSSSVVGQLLLVVGGLLLAAGTAWCARLTGQAVLS